MVFGFLLVARVIKLPVRVRRGGSVRWRRGRSGIARPLRIHIRFGRNGNRWLSEKISRGAYRAIVFIAPHDVTEREKYARKQQHEHEQTDDMPAFEYTLSGAPSFSSRRHPYFCAPKFLVH